MELIISILCLLLGGAYCEDGGAGGAAPPTAVATAVVRALITPTPEVAVWQDPYTPLDPNCNFNDFYAQAPLAGISHVAGSSHARTCWLAENYDRFYLNILDGCPACDRAAYYREHGRSPTFGEGYYYLDGEWVDGTAYYGTFREVVARLDRYLDAEAQCVARNPVAPAAMVRAMRFASQGLCGVEGTARNTGCPAALERQVRSRCGDRLRRGLLTPR